MLQVFNKVNNVVVVLSCSFTDSRSDEKVQLLNSVQSIFIRMLHSESTEDSLSYIKNLFFHSIRLFIEKKSLKQNAIYCKCRAFNSK